MKANGNKDSAMAKHLIKQGYPHGKTKSARRNEVPNRADVGSAAYRRLKDGKRGR